METKEKKDVGSIKLITLKIVKPFEMDTEIEYKNLSLFVGANGSGKTFVLKMTWFLNMVAATIIKKEGLEGTGNTVEDVVQYTLDKSFDNPEEFEGSIGIDYDNGSVGVIFMAGKIINISSDLDGIDTMPIPIFMSKDTRTFNQMKMILQIRKLVEREDKILETVKLYDYSFVMMIEAKLKHGYKLDDKFKETLEKFDMEKYDIQSFKMMDNSFWFTNSKGKDRELTTLSAGEQSIINMFLASS